MAIIPIRGLGARGIAPDMQPYGIPPYSAWVAHNMRVNEGQMASAPGYARYNIADSGDGAIDGTDLVPKTIGGWIRDGTPYWLICATDSLSAHRLYIFDGTDLTEVSPGAAAVATDDWKFIQMGPRLIAHSPSEIPLYLDSGVGTFTTIADWDTRPGGNGWRCDILVPFGAFLVAAPITDGGGEDRYASVAWSDELPPDIDSGSMSWDYADTTTLSGENVLEPSAGRILAMEPLGQQLIIYCEFSVWAMSFVGGTAVFNFRQIFNDDGILNANGVAKIDDNRHAVIGRNNIYIHDGNSKMFPADNKVRNFFYNDMQNQNIAAVHTQLLRDDVLFCYAADPETVDPADPAYDRALVYNWRYDAWTTQDLPEIRDMTNAPLPVGSGTWISDSETWDDDPSAWDIDVAIGTLLPIWTSSRNLRIYQDLNGDQFDGAAISWRLRFEQQDFDQILGEMGGPATINRWKRLRAMWPQVAGEGNITIGAAGYSTYPAPVTYSVTPDDLTVLSTFNVGTDHKASFEVSGRYISIEIKPESANVPVRWVGADLDLVLQTYRQ